MIRQYFITYLALAAAVVFWGFSFIATKVALQSLTPFCLIFIRFFLASLFFSLLLFRRSAPPISQDTFRKLGLLAVFQPGLYFFFETYGLKYTSATKTSLIIATIPIVVVLLSSLFLRERLRPINIMGIICSLVGVSLLVFGSSAYGSLGSLMSGDLLIAGAVLSAAVYIIFARHLGQTISPMQITGLQIIYGTVIFLPFFLWDMQQVDWLNLAPAVLFSVFWLTVFATIGAFSCYNFALSRVAAARASVFINAIPLVTAFGAWLLLGERLTPLQMAGGAVVISAVYLANYRSKARPHQAS
jgi:drug/metabolite transporter (DMT)-like permease